MSATAPERLPPPAGYTPVSFDAPTGLPERANISNSRAANALKGFEGAERILYRKDSSAAARLLSQTGRQERARKQGSRASSARPRGGASTPTLPPLDHGTVGSISQQYDRFVDLRSVSSTDTQALKRLDLNQWLASYQQEQTSYSSVSIYAEMKLQEAMRLDAENTPSAFRTAVCADLFFQVSELFGRYRGLMHAIGHELCASIYTDYPDPKPGAVGGAASSTPGGAEAGAEDASLEHSTLTPFYAATKAAQARVTRLETEVSELSDTTKFYVREARTRERAVTVAQRPLNRLLLRIYFHEWLSSQQNNQGRLLKIVMQWKDAKAQQMLMKCLFQGWKRISQVLSLHM
eukprot:COSAG05_NODE_195_length_14550_cov_203.233686_3_plen_349_part_00